MGRSRAIGRWRVVRGMVTGSKDIKALVQSLFKGTDPDLDLSPGSGEYRVAYTDYRTRKDIWRSTTTRIVGLLIVVVLMMRLCCVTVFSKSSHPTSLSVATNDLTITTVLDYQQIQTLEFIFPTLSPFPKPFLCGRRWGRRRCDRDLLRQGGGRQRGINRLWCSCRDGSNDPMDQILRNEDDKRSLTFVIRIQQPFLPYLSFNKSRVFRTIVRFKKKC